MCTLREIIDEVFKLHFVCEDEMIDKFSGRVYNSNLLSVEDKVIENNTIVLKYRGKLRVTISIIGLEDYVVKFDTNGLNSTHNNLHSFSSILDSFDTFFGYKKIKGIELLEVEDCGVTPSFEVEIDGIKFTDTYSFVEYITKNELDKDN